MALLYLKFNYSKPPPEGHSFQKRERKTKLSRAIEEDSQGSDLHIQFQKAKIAAKVRRLAAN